MKKGIVNAVLCGAVAVSGVCAAAYADEPVLTSAPQNAVQGVVINGETFNAGELGLYTKGDRVMIPVRKVAEKLGFTVLWDNDRQGARLDNGEVNTVLYIGSDSYYMASSTAIGMSAPTALGAAPELVGEKTYAPADIFEILYCNPSAVYEKDGKLYIDKDAKDGGDNGVQIPNPFTSHKNIDEAKKAVNFTVKVPGTMPDGYNAAEVQTMGSDFLQIFYSKGEKEILYRTAKGNDDISGDYNKYKKTTDIKVDGMTVTVRGNENIAGAVWKSGELAYSLMFDDEVSEAELAKIIKSLS